jgi:hypothetical protein
MRDSTLRLLFAGALAMGGLVATLVIAVVGIVVGLATTEIISISGPFASVTFAAVTYFLGVRNGTEATRRNGGEGGFTP